MHTHTHACTHTHDVRAHVHMYVAVWAYQYLRASENAFGLQYIKYKAATLPLFSDLVLQHIWVHMWYACPQNHILHYPASISAAAVLQSWCVHTLRTHPHTCTHLNTHPSAHVHAHTHTHLLSMCYHLNAHTYLNTHTHTHTCNWFVSSWPPFITGLLYDDPPPSRGQQIAYKNLGC